MTGVYKVREWWLVRHAPVKASGLIYGQLDLDADFSKSDRLDALANILPQKASFVTSDLARCRKTAQCILDRHGGMNSHMLERTALREQHFGIWEGRPYLEVEVEDEARYRSFFIDPVTCKPEGGESFEDLTKRVENEIHTLLRLVEERNLILFTHAGVIRAIVGQALGMVPQKMLSLAIDPLSLTHLTSFQNSGETSWRVNFVNDLSRS